MKTLNLLPTYLRDLEVGEMVAFDDDQRGATVVRSVTSVDVHQRERGPRYRVGFVGDKHYWGEPDDVLDVVAGLNV